VAGALQSSGARKTVRARTRSAAACAHPAVPGAAGFGRLARRAAPTSRAMCVFMVRALWQAASALIARQWDVARIPKYRIMLELGKEPGCPTPVPVVSSVECERVPQTVHALRSIRIQRGTDCPFHTLRSPWPSDISHAGYRTFDLAQPTSRHPPCQKPPSRTKYASHCAEFRFPATGPSPFREPKYAVI
jgi:hypothetical protein